ncbi:hypothetical protein PFISCL1PPCAC_25691, partial [Pristionchus fissidentatus]
MDQWPVAAPTYEEIENDSTSPKECRAILFYIIRHLGEGYIKARNFFFSVVELYRYGRNEEWITVENLTEYEKKVIREHFSTKLYKDKQVS